MLDQNLLGIYLHGSLALGGFQPGRSDIDVIVVTAQRIELETKRRCIELLLRISRMPCPPDIRFLVEQDLFPYQHPLLCDLHYHEIWRENYHQELGTGTWKHWSDKAKRDPDLAVHLMVLHRYGICLSGKPIAEALPPVPERDFRDTIIKDVQVTQGKPLYDPISFVLNACRAYPYLQDGKILSKDAGGFWGSLICPISIIRSSSRHPHSIEVNASGDQWAMPPGMILLHLCMKPSTYDVRRFSPEVARQNKIAKLTTYRSTPQGEQEPQVNSLIQKVLAAHRGSDTYAVRM